MIAAQGALLFSCPDSPPRFAHSNAEPTFRWESVMTRRARCRTGELPRGCVTPALRLPGGESSLATHPPRLYTQQARKRQQDSRCERATRQRVQAQNACGRHVPGGARQSLCRVRRGGWRLRQIPLRSKPHSRPRSGQQGHILRGGAWAFMPGACRGAFS